eukprot:TRINITY_DN78466_c0_g1_i1.p1 TRINITY_DN78466_c0_g1~~TRINITY_DN78466_c0_g1_i1.p1  ORF type:complete len:444 (-),score=55.05 TRINITY_DN78466_c0_g1_i1:53-1384(-)
MAMTQRICGARRMCRLGARPLPIPGGVLQAMRRHQTPVAFSQQLKWSSSGHAPVDVRLLPERQEDKVPVLILTGFLGSGKTTLLNRILQGNHGLRLAVIQNEFGEVGIDHLLTSEHFGIDTDIFQMNNGCLCCTVRSDLAPIVAKLYESQATTGRLDGIVVETTGLAVPGPVLQSFLHDSPSLLTQLDGVVTVVDALNCRRHFDRARETIPEAVRGGLGSEDLYRWMRSSGKAELREPNEPNECLEQVAVADVLLLNKCDLVPEETIAEIETELRVVNPFAKLIRCVKADAPLEQLLKTRSFDLDRVASLLPFDEASTSDENSHGHSHGHSHSMTEGRHDSSVTSVSIRHGGRVDMAKVEAWMGDLLARHGEQIYRMKGVLAIAGETGEADKKLAYHGVHTFFQGDILGVYQEREMRDCRLVFIGRGLDGEALQRGFLACSVE